MPIMPSLDDYYAYKGLGVSFEQDVETLRSRMEEIENTVNSCVYRIDKDIVCLRAEIKGQQIARDSKDDEAFKKQKVVLNGQLYCIADLNKQIVELEQKKNQLRHEIEELPKIRAEAEASADLAKQIAKGHGEQLGMMYRDNKRLKHEIQNLQVEIKYLKECVERNQTYQQMHQQGILSNQSHPGLSKYLQEGQNMQNMVKE